MMPLAVRTGVVVIIVAAEVVLLALIVATSMRGRRRGVGRRRDETRRDLDQAREPAARSEHERDVTQTAVQQPTDASLPDDASNSDSSTSAAAPDRRGVWRRL